MSPTIRSKGGQPLFIGGQVAGADTCCCENPPPPYCGCSDYCPYFIEVTAPSYLAVKSPPALCDSGGAFASVSPQSDMQGFGCSISGWEVSEPANPPPNDYAQAAVSINGNNLRIGIASSVLRAYGTFQKTFPNPSFPSGTTIYFAEGRASASVSVYCDDYSAAERKYYAILELQMYFGIGNQSNNVFHQIAKRSVHELPSHCARSPRSFCIDTNDLIRLIDQPVVVSVGGTATSLGAWQQEGVTFSTRQQVVDFAGEEVGSYIDCIVNAFSATFRITSRPSCRDASCTCNSELYGLQLTLGYFTATIGEYYFYEDTITYRLSSALQNNGWSIVLWEKDSEWRFTKMLRVDMYCDSSSGSPKWYAYIRTRCIEYDNQGVAIYDSTDSWMGTFDCYESCEFAADDSNGLPRSRANGDPIPLGDVQNVEYLGRESIYPECNPPDLPVVRIGQVETC